MTIERQQPASPSPQAGTAASWREIALEKSEVITDAWEVTKTYAGRIAEWVLFGCMVMNIIEILPGVTLWPTLSNLVLGTQVVMLDVGGFSLASMGDQAREQGDEQAARRASTTGGLLIGIMIVTLLLVTVGLLWPVARPYTNMAEKGLILVRVVMTVVYSHVIHSLRGAERQREHAAVSEQFADLSARITKGEQRITEECSELVERTIARLSGQLSEQLERKGNEHPTRSELATISELVEAHTRLLSELAPLPMLLEEREQARNAQVRTVVQQEVKAAVEANTEQRGLLAPGTSRPKLSVVEANTEQRTAKDRTPNERTGEANRTESDKGAFVRRCLSETPTMRNSDIQRKAREKGITISPAYISEVRKAFVRADEQSA